MEYFFFFFFLNLHLLLKHLSDLREDLLLSFAEVSGGLKQNLHFEQKVQSPGWEQNINNHGIFMHTYIITVLLN